MTSKKAVDAASACSLTFEAALEHGLVPVTCSIHSVKYTAEVKATGDPSWQCTPVQNEARPTNCFFELYNGAAASPWNKNE